MRTEKKPQIFLLGVERVFAPNSADTHENSDYRKKNGQKKVFDLKQNIYENKYIIEM